MRRETINLGHAAPGRAGLGRELRTHLDARAPFADHVESIVLDAAGLLARIDVAGAERLSCEVERLEVAPREPGRWSAGELRDRANRLCGKVTYLLEPLAPIEIDPLGARALVRSRSPRLKQDGLDYFELLATGDRKLSMRRFHYDADRRVRDAVPFALTNEQLECLVVDLADAVAEPLR